MKLTAPTSFPRKRESISDFIAQTLGPGFRGLGYSTSPFLIV